nr:hypothetical protein [Tolivirales sp.]
MSSNAKPTSPKESSSENDSCTDRQTTDKVPATGTSTAEGRTKHRRNTIKYRQDSIQATKRYIPKVEDFITPKPETNKLVIDTLTESPIVTPVTPLNLTDVTLEAPPDIPQQEQLLIYRRFSWWSAFKVLISTILFLLITNLIVHGCLQFTLDSILRYINMDSYNIPRYTYVFWWVIILLAIQYLELRRGYCIITGFDTIESTIKRLYKHSSPSGTPTKFERQLSYTSNDHHKQLWIETVGSRVNRRQCEITQQSGTTTGNMYFTANIEYKSTGNGHVTYTPINEPRVLKANVNILSQLMNQAMLIKIKHSSISNAVLLDNLLLACDKIAPHKQADLTWKLTMAHEALKSLSDGSNQLFTSILKELKPTY